MSAPIDFAAERHKRVTDYVPCAEILAIADQLDAQARVVAQESCRRDDQILPIAFELVTFGNALRRLVTEVKREAGR